MTTESKSIELKDILRIIYRRRWVILSTFVLTTAGVIAATLELPKQYETRMKVLVRNDRPDMIVSPDHNSTSDYHGETSEAQVNSEIELLTSNDLLKQVVIKCGLDRRQHVADSETAIERAVERLQTDLKVGAARKANIIVVGYVDTDPRRAVSVLSNLESLYLEEHLRVHGVPGTYEFFKREADRYQKEMKQAEDKLDRYRQRENIVSLTDQKYVTMQKAVESENSLMQADATIGEYTQKIAEARRQLGTAEPRVVTQSRTLSNQFSVERFQTMLAELQNRRTQLLAKFQPDDRLVQEIDKEIADTRAALDKAIKLNGVEEATDVNPVHQALQIDIAKEENELAGITSKRQSLARQMAIYKQQMMRLANATTEFDDLVRLEKEAEDKYLLYEKKTEEARITESLDQQKIANVTIAENPMEPHKPSKPNVKLNIAMGTLLAFFLSLGVAFAAEYFRDETVRDVGELEELTKLPVLAVS
jgi:uncharacterized protein involved in exopolysaccharide biosynthesis